MILQKDKDGNVPYLLNTDSPPSAVTWVLGDGGGKVLASGSVSALPKTQSISSATRRGASDDYDLAVTLGVGGTLDPLIRAGVSLVLRDSRGRKQDPLCTGVASGVVSVSGLALESGDSVASLWCPEIEIVLPGSALAEVSDTYTLKLSITAGGSDVLYFAVCPYTLQLPLTLRTYLDFFPAAADRLGSLSKRKDWSRVCDSAREMLESRLRSSGVYLNLIAPVGGLKRCLACALNVVLAPSIIPEMWKSDADAFIDRAEKTFNQAVEELLSYARVDANADGNIADDEKNQVVSVGRLRL